MKTFTKGVLITVVDDDDYRIAEYLASGWRETATVEKLKADIDARIAKALSDANKSNTSSGKKGKNTAPEQVSCESRICIQDSTGKIRTVIFEEDYESAGYKAKGWTVVKEDWTKDRVIRKPIDYEREKKLTVLGNF